MNSCRSHKTHLLYIYLSTYVGNIIQYVLCVQSSDIVSSNSATPTQRYGHISRTPVYHYLGEIEGKRRSLSAIIREHCTLAFTVKGAAVIDDDGDDHCVPFVPTPLRNVFHPNNRARGPTTTWWLYTRSCWHPALRSRWTWASMTVQGGFLMHAHRTIFMFILLRVCSNYDLRKTYSSRETISYFPTCGVLDFFFL